MQPYDVLGIPSPEECHGVVGLTMGLFLLTIGIGIHLFVAATVWSLGLIVAGLFIGWSTFVYCWVWGQAMAGVTD